MPVRAVFLDVGETLVDETRNWEAWADFLDVPRFTLLGALCMVGTLWLVVRARSSTRAGALAIAVLAVYAWSLLSMLTTLAGTTLLSFRLQPTLTILLTAAGAFGFIDVTRALAARVKPENSRRVVASGLSQASSVFL